METIHIEDNKINRLKGLYAQHFNEAVHTYVVVRAPGRVELAGNHTDHQGGKVISSAIARSTYVMAAPQHAAAIDVYMEGYGRAHVGLEQAGWNYADSQEVNTSQALVRGMASQLADAGISVGGCRIVTCSDIPQGVGLSSSAAFEVAIGAALRELFAGDSGVWNRPADIAMAGVVAENQFFGKPCGSQDQLASAIGGVIAIDFENHPPTVSPLDFQVETSGYVPCLVDCHCDHSQFTNEFAAITSDMHDVAIEMGKQRLKDVSAERFYARIAMLREKLGDLRVLRAMHYFDEEARVVRQLAALQSGDFESFLVDMRYSGESSAQFLQNVSPRTDNGSDQPAMIALALCSHILGTSSGWRIHGGGFGGGVLAFVPKDDIVDFERHINSALGYNACIWVKIGQPGVQVESFNE